MSIWTHVVGSIRFDGICGVNQPPDLGTPCTYEDDEEQWDKCDIPCGGEGSLVTSLWTNPSNSCMALWTATIFGDLRSYENGKEVIEYFNRIIKGQFVRGGCFTFCIGQNKPRIFTYIDSEKCFVEAK